LEFIIGVGVGGIHYSALSLRDNQEARSKKKKKANKMRKVTSGNAPIKHNKRGHQWKWNTPHPHNVYRTTY
jgi:hypothetical protein